MTPVLDVLLQEGAVGLVGAALVIALTAALCCRLHLGPRANSLLVLVGAGSAIWLLQRFAPVSAAADGWPGLAGLLLFAAFPLLVCERVVAASVTVPEAAALAALLRLPVVLLLAFAAVAVAPGFGLAVPLWVLRLLALPPLLVAAELALRALAGWFLPPAQRAGIPIASLVAGLLQPASLRPSALADRLRRQLGLDIGRSWALGFARAAAPPILLALLVLAWGLTGVVRIERDARGSYERLGAPVAMLKPGLHLILPWPFGVVRPVEYGVVHAVPVGAELAGASPADTTTADGAPPASANRLWDTEPGTDIPYLIADRSGGRESFEAVSVDVRVLYRVGLDDASARRALYATADPATLVRALSARLLARFFAGRTLDEVLGARREQVADALRSALQAELDVGASGLEVVALVIESLHPPGGAAQAYRSVQAAEITASTRRAQETGRASGTASVARRDAHDAIDQAQALAAELTGAASAERSQADADSLAYRDAGRAFLLERYFGDLRLALARAALEIVDHRLPGQQQPMLDLRDIAPSETRR